MRILIAAAVVSAIGGSAAATPVPASYTYFGNLQANGLGACSQINGAFPASVTYFQDNQTGAVGSLWINLSIYNNTPKAGAPGTVVLPLQSLFLEINLPPATQSYVVVDPQLFQTTNPQFGSYTGKISFSAAAGFDTLTFGTNFLQPNPTVVTLTSGSCIIQIQGVLTAAPL